MIAAIILAAGRSARMGQPKPLLPFGAGPRQTFIQQLVETAQTAGFSDVYVVGRPADDLLRAEVVRCGGVFVENPHADEGQLSSLQAGLRHLEAQFALELDGILVLPVDAPLIGSEAVARLVEVAGSSSAQILRATHAGRHGHPVLFKRPVFAELHGADPQVGARAVVRADPRRVENVEVGDPGVTIDIDTPDDYRRHFGVSPPDKR